MDAGLREVMERVGRVERASFVSLYEGAPPELNAGLHEEGPLLVAWLGTYDDPGFSCVFDLHLADDPDEAIERMVEIVRSAGGEVIGVDTHPDLDPWLDDAWFASHGFTPAYGEQVWWREITGFVAPQPPAGVEVRRISAAETTTFARTLNVGFGEEPDAALGRAYAAVIDKPGWWHYLAFVDDRPGAAAAMFVMDGVVDCFVASTIPEARRRGAQTALINQRLADGAGAGCDIATAQSVLGNASPRNFARRGFEPVYQRMIYARTLRD